MLYKKQNKTGAIELSVGTVVIIVLGVSMLILGIILVRQIFTFTSDSVNTISEKTKQELNTLFGEENANVVVRLGPQNTVKIKPGTDSFGVAIAARTPDGSTADRERLQYKLTLDQANAKNCIDKNYLGDIKTKDLFKNRLDEFKNFDKYDGANVYSIISIEVPKGTATCSQKVFIDVKDTKTNQEVGGTFFIIDIVKGSFF